MSFCKSFAGLSLNGKGSLKSVGFPSSGSRVTGLTIEAAQKKGGGSTKNGRDSNAQRRGVKVFGGQPVKAGGIIIRQTGTTVHPGDNVAAGKDHTLYALQAGIVVFKKNKYKKQVSVVNVADYEVPEGCKQKESDSRRTRRREQYANARRSKPASSAPTVAAVVVVAP